MDTLKRNFLAAGGTLLEHTAFRSCEVVDDGVKVHTLRAAPAAKGSAPAGTNGASASGAEESLDEGDVNRPLACSPAAAAGSDRAARNEAAGASRAASTAAAGGGAAATSSGRATLTCRLLLDCMGHYSPIVKQVRGGAKPQGMVVVVGGCMGGVPPEKNTSADLLYSFQDAEDDLQVRPYCRCTARVCVLLLYCCRVQLPRWRGRPVARHAHAAACTVCVCRCKVAACPLSRLKYPQP